MKTLSLSSAFKSTIALAAVGFLTGSVALANGITPSFGTFGNLAGATFGGSGIPTDPSAITTVTTNGDTITLGLIAHQRYFNPALNNNGAGTYFATPGFNDGLGSPHPLGPTWNFGFYIGLAADVGNTDVYHYSLTYGNNTTSVFSTLALGGGSASGVGQDSWNLSMGFLNTIGYDPNAVADYGFELKAFNSSNQLVANSAINVNVASVPDAGSTWLLSVLGSAGILAVARMQRRRTTIR